MKRTIFAIIVIFTILFLDQSSKIWIKTNMFINQEKVVFDWFRIHFIENPGMAFGLEFGGSYGKLILSLFRIVAVFVIGFIIKQLIDKKVSYGLILGMSMIMAGALGNIIDSVIYGVIFSESGRKEVADFILDAPQWGQVFHGKVVDMLHFPLLRGYWPDWVPMIGGNFFEFFRPVFNLADSAITGGILYLLLFHRNYFTKPEEEEDKKETPEKLEEDLVQSEVVDENNLSNNLDSLENDNPLH